MKASFFIKSGLRLREFLDFGNSLPNADPDEFILSPVNWPDFIVDHDNISDKKNGRQIERGNRVILTEKNTLL